MIMVENRKLNIPLDEARLGYEGDNLVAERSFCLSDMALSGFEFRLDIRKANGKAGIVELHKTVSADSITLSWTLTSTELDIPGELAAQLRAFNTEGDEVWHSAVGLFHVGDSVHAEDAFPSPLPSEFAEMEKRVAAAVQEVESLADEIRAVAEQVSGYRTEEWTFVLDDGSTVTKKVVLSS